MPFELQIIRAAEFVRLGPHGHLDLAGSKAALAALALACQKRGLNQALLDLRALPVPPKPLFSPAELAALVETFKEVGFGPRQRLAVLYRSDPHQGARMFAFISRMRGWQVRAFEDFEHAVLWLSEQQYERPAREGQTIPISFSDPKSPKKAASRPSSHRPTRPRISPRPR
jgi:hypothetical protein